MRGDVKNYQTIEDVKLTPQDAYVLVGSSLFKVRRGYIVAIHELAGNCVEELLESARRVTAKKLYVDTHNFFNEHASQKAGYLTSDMDFDVEAFIGNGGDED